MRRPWTWPTRSSGRRGRRIPAVERHRRAVLDPGALVAAAIAPTGVCADLLRRATQDDFFVVACPILLGEVQEVLHRPKFRRYLTETEADQFVQAVGGIAELHPDPDFEH